jgi:hypothetical protein
MNIKDLKLAIALGEYDAATNGREIDANVLCQQIGQWNIMAISGGRVRAWKSTVFLPVSRGYWVAVTLTAADDYIVSRIMIRAGKVTVKETFEGVYAENIGEVAYRASCFENAA